MLQIDKVSKFQVYLKKNVCLKILFYIKDILIHTFFIKTISIMITQDRHELNIIVSIKRLEKFKILSGSWTTGSKIVQKINRSMPRGI